MSMTPSRPWSRLRARGSGLTSCEIEEVLFAFWSWTGFTCTWNENANRFSARRQTRRRTSLYDLHHAYSARVRGRSSHPHPSHSIQIQSGSASTQTNTSNLSRAPELRSSLLELPFRPVTPRRRHCHVESQREWRAWEWGEWEWSGETRTRRVGVGETARDRVE